MDPIERSFRQRVIEDMLHQDYQKLTETEHDDINKLVSKFGKPKRVNMKKLRREIYEE
jgi:hypothetical protein